MLRPNVSYDRPYHIGNRHLGTKYAKGTVQGTFRIEAVGLNGSTIQQSILVLDSQQRRYVFELASSHVKTQKLRLGYIRYSHR